MGWDGIYGVGSGGMGYICSMGPGRMRVGWDETGQLGEMRWKEMERVT